MGASVGTRAEHKGNPMTSILPVLAQGGAPGAPGGNVAPVVLVVFVAVLALVILVGAFLVLNVFNLYVQAMLSGAPVALGELVGMRFRKVNARTIVLARIRAVKAGLDVTAAQLETRCLAGGRVEDTVSALIAAKAAGLELTWEAACAIDLAGYDAPAAVAAAAQQKITGLDAQWCRDARTPRRGGEAGT
jgi:uncharacterized protein YqfA (UPF0365 family)